MTMRLALFAASATYYAYAQAPPDVTPLHFDEPIVIQDGSVKIHVYSSTGRDNHADGNTVIAKAFRSNKATINVPVRILPPGRLLRTSAPVHGFMAVDGYVFDVEQLVEGRYEPYGQIVFRYSKSKWIISPEGSNPLSLVSAGEPVALSGDWANHFRTTYEYGHGNRHLRLGAVRIVRQRASRKAIRFATSCSAFRIEPSNHIAHQTPFQDLPCEGKSLNPKTRFPPVRINGVKTITAIDVSAEPSMKETR